MTAILTQLGLALAPTILEKVLGPNANPSQIDPTDTGQQQQLQNALVAAGGAPVTTDVAEIILSIVSGGASTLVFDSEEEVDTIAEVIIDQVVSRLASPTVADPLRSLVGLPPMAAGLTSGSAGYAASLGPTGTSAWLGSRLAPYIDGPRDSERTFDPSVLPVDMEELHVRAELYSNACVQVAEMFGGGANLSPAQAMQWLFGTVNLRDGERFEVGKHCSRRFVSLLRVVLEADGVVLAALNRRGLVRYGV